jgi:Domain of unknown function (DUF6134)
MGTVLRRYVILALLLTAALAGPALAAPERYDYRVIHPTYGDIGTYTNTVERRGEDTEVRSELRIAVRMLGIVVYRQEAERTERWHGHTLVSFDGVTVTNGEKLPVHGEARGGAFVVTTPSGSVTAPADVHPSNPWSPMVLKTDVMMSTRTGAVQPVHVSGGELEPVNLPGITRRLHQYEVVSDKHQFVWLDDKGTPIAFRTVESGTPVDFVLTRREQLAAGDR